MQNLQGDLANSTTASDIALLASSISFRVVSSQMPSSSDSTLGSSVSVSTPSGTNEYYLPLANCLA